MNMAKTKTLGKTILASTLVLLLSACGEDPTPLTAQEKVTKILTAGGGTWPAASVTVDGVDVTEELFPGFSITFQESTYTTTGSSPVWLRQDTWHFKDENANAIIRGQDGREIVITSISETQLTLTLEWPVTTHDGGRQGSLKGRHEFILNK